MLLKGMDSYYGNELHFKVKDSEGFHNDLLSQMEKWDAKIVESDIAINEDGTAEYNMYIRRKSELGYDELKTFVNGRDDILSYRSNLSYNHINK